MIRSEPLINNYNSTIDGDNLISKNIKVATYNVEIDMSNMLLRSKKRYEYIISNLLPNLSPDIIGLNEVTESFVQILQTNKSLQSLYYTSNLSVPKSKKFHNIVLSKFPFDYIYHENSRRDEVICLFQTPSSYIIFISVHLTAYEENIKKREAEMKQLLDFIANLGSIDKRVKHALDMGNLIISGDFNLHFKFEAKNIIYGHGFTDTFEELDMKNSKENLYSWDTYRNSYINSYLVFDNRRMNLDRIILSKKSNLLCPISYKLFGTESIGNLLYPSDHFGIICEFKILDGKNDREFISKVDPNSIEYKEDPKRRTINQIIRMRIAGSVSILGGVLYIAGRFLLGSFI